MEERRSNAVGLLLALAVFCLHNPGVTSYCVPRDYGLGSVVCVDTLQHCDLPGPLPSNVGGRLLVVTSDKAGQRWNQTYYTWTTVNNDAPESETQTESASAVEAKDAFELDSAALRDGSAASKAASGASRADFGGSNAEFSASNSDFGTSGVDFGPSKVKFGPSKVKFGLWKAKFRSSKAESSPSKAEFGPSKAEFGALEAEFGASEAKFNASKAEFGTSKAKFSVSKSEFGPSKAEFGASSAISGVEDSESAALKAEVTLSVDRSKRYQKIEGFGGAFTDAAALNILSLPGELQDCVIRSYFSDAGLQYTMGRVPIGGSDFSVRAYTYDDLQTGQTDENLAQFALQREDFLLKLPLIAAAERARNSSEPLKLVASAWSAPVWMKTGPRLDGKGKLQRRYWAVWARYIARFLKEYQKRGVKFWAVTAQNEPTDGLITDFPINAMGWTALEQAEWVGQSLGPTLEAEGFSSTKIFVLDDNRIALPHWIDVMASVNNTLAYVSGIAVHWYIDFLVPPFVLEQTHELYPHLPILYTEACTGHTLTPTLSVYTKSCTGHTLTPTLSVYTKSCTGHTVTSTLSVYTKSCTGHTLTPTLSVYTKSCTGHTLTPTLSVYIEACTGQWPWQPLKVVLGSWLRAVYYLDDIIDAVREVYKQPLFYAIGHVSKFVPDHSVRLGVKATNWPTTMRVVAFERPDNCTAVIIINKKRAPVQLEVVDGGRNSGIIKLAASSFTSFLWC
ncbi:Glycosyl hydrolase family 30 TIM-barrel domain [Trinorchestia longiramus]|nr:Glycosyl hydrolase family 30 TIM-barrel domain [Trinorchestia longiramus]